MSLLILPSCKSSTLIVLMALIWGQIPTLRADGLPKTDIAKLGKAATVFVVAKTGTGSGFCVHPSGLFITNQHVVQNDAEVTVVLNASLKDQKVLKAKVLRSDKQLDLALLHTDGQKHLPYLKLGSIDKLAELAELVVCGFPFGKRLAMDKNEYPPMSINTGSVSALRLKEGALHELQLDIELNPGNSGGPALDLNGKVVGVVVSRVPGARINFAIPVTKVSKFLDKPDIRLTAPAITKMNQNEALEFHVHVISLIPPPQPLNVELILRAGDEPDRPYKMALKDGAYFASAVPVPLEKVRRLVLSTQFENGAIEGLIEDGAIQVGAQKVQLKDCQRILIKPQSQVFLNDGKALEGPLGGLEKMAVLIGGQKLVLDCSGAMSLRLQAAPVPSGVECTVVARLGEKEVGRVQTRLSIQSSSAAEPADQNRVAIRPPRIGVDRVVKTLPDIASDIQVGGNGRYFVLHLPKLKKLAVFDVNEAAIVRYIPLTEDKIVFAAGLEKVVIGLTTKGILERWDLETGKKEQTRPAPSAANVDSVLMGSASRGPVIVNDSFIDLATLKPLPMKSTAGIPPPWSPVSADGTVFGSWNSNQSPADSTTFVLQGEDLKRYGGGGLGHIVPGPDGRAVFTATGVVTNQLKTFGGESSKLGYCLPAVEGSLFLSLTPGENGKGGALTVYLLGNEQPLVKDVGFTHGIHFDSWDRTTFGPWKRVFFIPRAKLIVVFPEGNDRLELHPFNLDEALDKSNLDYLLVTSLPLKTAKRGAEYTYQITAKSKKGNVKYQFGSGPEGLEVTPTGLVKWRVPASIRDNSADVLLNVRDDSGQEVFHSFTISLID